VETTYGTKLVTLIHHDSETIPVFYFFHAKTPAVPNGRLMVLADPTTVFEDGPLDKGEGKGCDCNQPRPRRGGHEAMGHSRARASTGSRRAALRSSKSRPKATTRSTMPWAGCATARR
jgi:hypothetical protein